MTYREGMVVDVLVAEAIPRYAPRHWKSFHRYYLSVRKRRFSCSKCHHHHGPSRNHRPEACRAPGCGCRHMVDWIFVRPPWLWPREHRGKPLAIRSTRYPPRPR